MTLRILGGQVDVMTLDDLLDFIGRRIADRAPAIVANHNLNSLNLVRRDPLMRAFYAQADRVEIDSTPLIVWARLMGLPVGRANRLTYLDWREAFWGAAATRGWRVFHLGCAPGVGEAGLATVTARRADLVAATRHGFFALEGAENDAIIDAIRAFRPDVLMVGMGMPRQERWILANRGRLGPCVILPIGAALAYEAGAVATPPRWTGRLGVEWLWRLFSEPGRLWRRYLVEPWSLLPQAWVDVRRYRVRGRSAAGDP